MASIGIFQNIFRGGDHAAQVDVRLDTVYGNGQFTGEMAGATSQPAVTDVRLGVSYNDGNSTGTLNVPRVGRVIEGVQVDHTVGTYDEVQAGNVLLGVQYGEDGSEYTGTLDTGAGGVVPDASDVRSGVATGVTVGTLIVPRVGRVIDGTPTDNTFGTFVFNSEPFVSNGRTYGEDGIEFTGTLDTGCPVPPSEDVGTYTIRCVDETGINEEGVQVDARLVCWPDGSTGTGYDATIQSALTDVNGVATFTLVRAATYQIRRGDSEKWYRVTVEDQPNGILPSIIGQP